MVIHSLQIHLISHFRYIVHSCRLITLTIVSGRELLLPRNLIGLATHVLAAAWLLFARIDMRFKLVACLQELIECRIHTDFLDDPIPLTNVTVRVNRPLKVSTATSCQMEGAASESESGDPQAKEWDWNSPIVPITWMTPESKESSMAHGKQGVRLSVALPSTETPAGVTRRQATQAAGKVTAALTALSSIFGCELSSAADVQAPPEKHASQPGRKAEPGEKLQDRDLEFFDAVLATLKSDDQVRQLRRSTRTLWSACGTGR